jgi:hypothetical protein
MEGGGTMTEKEIRQRAVTYIMATLDLTNNEINQYIANVVIEAAIEDEREEAIAALREREQTQMDAEAGR